LLFFKARFYSPVLGRFLSADTIVPDGKNPQQFNRYAYALNSPLKYIDPSGHMAKSDSDGAGSCIKHPLCPYSRIQPILLRDAPSAEVTYADPLQWDNPKWLDDGILLPDTIFVRFAGSFATQSLPWSNTPVSSPFLRTLQGFSRYTNLTASFEYHVGVQTYEHGSWVATYLATGGQVSIPAPKGASVSVGGGFSYSTNHPDDLTGFAGINGADFLYSIPNTKQVVPLNLEMSRSNSGSAAEVALSVTYPPGVAVRPYVGEQYTFPVYTQFTGGPYPPCAGMPILPNGGVCGVK
jgi:hypothetical protein